MNILPDFRTLRPTSLAEAVSALATGGEILAGGTDLLPNLRRGLGRPETLVDLTAISNFGAISVGADGVLRLGAGLTLEVLAEDERVRASWPVIAQAAALVAGPSHRAAATLGGNLCQDTRCVFYNQSEWWRSGNGYCLKYEGDKCHVVVKSDRCYATYHGDIAPSLMVMGATAEIVGPKGVRSLPLSELFREDGAQHLALEQGDVLAAILVPPAQGWVAAYTKARIRDAIDFPLAGLAVALKRDGDAIAGLRIAITGTNSAPLMVATDALWGRPWTAETAEILVQAVRKTSNVLKTTLTGVKYRRRVLLALVRQQVDALWTGK
ncbi:MAG: 4-hydroxybenzoyl-CoA reductase subunit beta [Magnetospirillum sp.]|nr:4-hydroxybenzoyl-CoA reductase subunit beta [Magnetospirillum sp.]